MKAITWLSPGDPPEQVPPVESTLDDPPGLLAAGGGACPPCPEVCAVKAVTKAASPRAATVMVDFVERCIVCNS